MSENQLVSHFLETPNVRAAHDAVCEFTNVKEEVRAENFQQQGVESRSQAFPVSYLSCRLSHMP